MENLPFVVLKKLFKMMPDRNETIKCSHVCRNWRAAYEMGIDRESLFLRFDEFLPLNHLLFYTNEPVVERFFFRLPNDPTIPFLHSDATRVHFAATLKKLLIFPPKHTNEEICEFSFQKQLNHFQNLEHLEFISWRLLTENDEIDLPKLKIFHLFGEIKKENARIVLNTPSLEVLSARYAQVTKFKILFPHKLKYLDVTLPGSGFKFETQFVNLECLVLFTKDRYLASAEGRKIYQLDDDFFEELPNLKFLFAPENEFNYSALRAAKRKFKLNDLKILDQQDTVYDVDYTNLHKFVEHREQLRSWPSDYDVEFTKLINCQLPFRHFKENYLRISDLTVRQVTNESLLIEFLRDVKIEKLTLDYDFNLSQSFFDEITDFLTIKKLISYESSWAAASNPSVASKMKFREFELKYEQFPRQVALAVLQNPSCLISEFRLYSGMTADRYEENRKIPKVLHHRFLHTIRRENDVFYCSHCKWSSANDPTCSGDSLGGTIRHIENDRAIQNTDTQEIRDIFL